MQTIRREYDIINLNASCRGDTIYDTFKKNISKPALVETIYILGVAPGCRASAIIYQNTRVYGNYPLKLAINASTRQLTVQPNATPIGDRLQSDNL